MIRASAFGTKLVHTPCLSCNVEIPGSTPLDLAPCLVPCHCVAVRFRAKFGGERVYVTIRTATKEAVKGPALTLRYRETLFGVFSHHVKSLRRISYPVHVLGRISKGFPLELLFRLPLFLPPSSPPPPPTLSPSLFRAGAPMDPRPPRRHHNMPRQRRAARHASGSVDLMSISSAPRSERWGRGELDCSRPSKSVRA